MWTTLTCTISALAFLPRLAGSRYELLFRYQNWGCARTRSIFRALSAYTRTLIVNRSIGGSSPLVEVHEVMMTHRLPSAHEGLEARAPGEFLQAHLECAASPQRIAL